MSFKEVGGSIESFPHPINSVNDTKVPKSLSFDRYGCRFNCKF